MEVVKRVLIDTEHLSHNILEMLAGLGEGMIGDTPYASHIKIDGLDKLPSEFDESLFPGLSGQ
jgi:hypothetical protein